MHTPLSGVLRTSHCGVNLHRLTPEESALYDELRDNRVLTGLRLEQEHIGFRWLSNRLQGLLGNGGDINPRALL